MRKVFQLWELYYALGNFFRTQTISLIKKREFKAAIVGLDRLLNALIVMHNAGFLNCKPIMCGLSFIEGDIIVCAMDDAVDDKRRDTALKAFMDARDFSNNSVGKLADEAVQALKSGVDFNNFKEIIDPDFPNDIIDILSDITNKFDDLLKPPYTSSNKSGGCYIATAVYGSYDCPQVCTLRHYRDFSLSKTWYGRFFISTYYLLSPTIVKWFGKTEWFNRFWRVKLDRIVEKLKSKGYSDIPYND